MKILPEMLFLGFRLSCLASRWFPKIRKKSPKFKFLKIVFREEFSFQIHNSFSTNSKQNELLLISSINTKIGGIFGGLEDQFWELK